MNRMNLLDNMFLDLEVETTDNRLRSTPVVQRSSVARSSQVVKVPGPRLIATSGETPIEEDVVGARSPLRRSDSNDFACSLSWRVPIQRTPQPA